MTIVPSPFPPARAGAGRIAVLDRCWLRARGTPSTCVNCPRVHDLHDLRGNQPNPAHGGPGRSRRRRATLFAAVRCARGSCGRPGRTVPCPTGPRQGRALAGQGGNLPLVYPRWTWAGGAADRPGQECPLTWIRPARRLATRSTAGSGGADVRPQAAPDSMATRNEDHGASPAARRHLRLSRSITASEGTPIEWSRPILRKWTSHPGPNIRPTSKQGASTAKKSGQTGRIKNDLER